MILKSYSENVRETNTRSAKRIVSQSQSDCEKHLNLLYRNHASDLLFTILNIVPQQETAEDILHDTFMKLKTCIHTHDSEKSQLLTWSKAIAKNLALDYLRLKSSRNNKLNQSIEFSEKELTSKHVCCFNPDEIGLRQLIKELSEEQMAIMELFYYKGFTHEEVSAALNIPLGTIKTRIRTSIQKLRKYFN